MNELFLVFLLSSQLIPAASFTLDCSSVFTAAGASFCVGVPVECEVYLDPGLCIGGVDIFTEDDLTVTITDSKLGLFNPSFSSVQSDGSSHITILTDYAPESYLATVSVNVAGTLNSNCTFSETHTARVERDVNFCDYPLSLQLAYSDFTCPGYVFGGDLIMMELELTSPSFALDHFELELNTSHPALLLTGYIFYDNSSDSTIFDADFGQIASPIMLQVLRVSKNETLFGNISFRVMPYVLPQANLYFSFHVSYSVQSHGTGVFTQRFEFNDCISGNITCGNISFHLPNYAEDDRVNDTFPPHADDLFYVDVPVTVPCVSTDLNLTITFPEFISDNYTRFFVNISEVDVYLPENMFYVTHLCSYQGRDQFSPSMCDFEVSTREPVLVQEEMYGPGFDYIYAVLGPLWYNLSIMENCTLDSPLPNNCTCLEQDIVVSFIGHVISDTCEYLPGPVVCNNESVCECPARSIFNENFIENFTFCDLPCENQTLADNITCEYEYVIEDTIVMDSPSIVFTDQYDYDVFQVNASMPAISIPINSYTGDAGDSYNLTCGYLHNAEYSSFTTYDLNYTFSADFHLDPVPNITVCFFNDTSEEPAMCEDLPFTNNTITREGFHPVFKLNLHRVELTVEVTIIQDVAPAETFSNPGDAIFRSLPCNNSFDLLPITCTNASSGSVTIFPVILKPWVIHYSDVEATITESPANPSYVTIGERFNMTILAFMPECQTGLHLYVTLPNEGENKPQVTLNDAYVTFLGSEMLNTTLFEDDNLTMGENISVIDGRVVDFFFGPRVFIPATLDNTREVHNQSFEIGIDCTVKNLPSLVNGRSITFEAFVETDNEVRTQVERISPRIAEPDLVFRPTDPPGLYDAGDEPLFEVNTDHHSSTRHTSAFRFNFSYIYPTEFFNLDEVDPSFVFTVDSIPVANFTPNATFNNSMGMVTYRLDEKEVDETVSKVLGLFLTNNVQSRLEYIVPFTAEWHSLPPGYEGGRSYEDAGELTVSISDLVIALSYSTSNPLTPGDDLQFQEQVSLNVTVTFSEGISELNLRVDHDNYGFGAHPFNITEGRVVHIGGNIRNLPFSVNDTRNTSDYITSNTIIDIMFDCGDNTTNLHDNTVNDDDRLILNLLGFVSNNGSSLTSVQRVRIEAEDQIHTDRNDRENLFLHHPEVQLSVGVDPTGSVDGGDVLLITLQVNHQAGDGFVSYDIGVEFALVTRENTALSITVLDSSTVVGGDCTGAGPVNISKMGSSAVNIQYLQEGCTAMIEVETTVPDVEAFSGSFIVFDSYISEYYAVDDEDDFIMVSRRNYASNTVIQNIIHMTSPTHNIRFLNTTSFIAPLDSLSVEHEATFLEGFTLNVSITFRVVIEPPGDSDLAGDFPISDPYQAVILNQTDNVLPSSLGDLFNSFDNADSARDVTTFRFTVTAPLNSAGNGFRVFSTLTFNNTAAMVDIPDVQTNLVYVILPTIVTDTNASHEIVRVGDNVTFGLSISRTDEMMPTYDILLTAVLVLPPASVLDPLFDPAEVTSVTSHPNGITYTLTLTPLSYTPMSASSLFFSFPCRTEALAVSVPYIEIGGHVEYESLPSNGYQYTQPVLFPRIYVREVDFTFELLNTSVELTDLNLLVLDEEAVFRAHISNVTGPSADLVLRVNLDDLYVEITGINILSVGSALDFTDIMVLNSSNEILVTFVDLSKVVFEPGEEDCPDCSIVADVYFRAVQHDARVQSAPINASVTYDFIFIEDPDILVVTPRVSLETFISGPLSALDDGAEFEINFTISHAMESQDAYNLKIRLNYPEELVLQPANFTLVFSNGTVAVISFQAIVDGLNISLLRQNESMMLVFPFQLDPSITVEELLAFELDVDFSNLEGSEEVGGLEANTNSMDSIKAEFLSLHFISLTSHVEDTSSAFTEESSFAINEVFQIVLEVPLPNGETDITIVAKIQTLDGGDIPIRVLDTSETFPVLVTTDLLNVTITETPNLIEITWVFGTVDNPGSMATAELIYTGVILDTNMSTVFLEFQAATVVDGVILSTTTLTADTLMPLLTISKAASVVPDSDPLMVQMTTVLTHDFTSTGPAFTVNVQDIVPEILEVILPFRLDTNDGQTFLMDSETVGNSTVLHAAIQVMPLDMEVNLTYFALISDENQVDGMFVAPTVVNYTTIRQEGIGLLYDTVFAGRSLISNASLCFNKMIANNIIEVKNIDVVVTTLFLTIIFLLILILIIVLIYYCIKRNKPKKPHKIAPAALVAAVIGRNEEEEYLIFKNRVRPLFSALLDALPQNTWCKREDVYECREADYIAEVEGSLLFAKGQMILHLFKFFLQSKTSLSEDKIAQKTELFELKVNILQKTLQESVKSELEKAGLQYGADKILKEEEQDNKHEEDDSILREAIPMNLSISAKVLQHVKEQHAREKADALDVIEMVSKKEKMKTIRHHTNYYLLSLKAIVSNILQEAAPSNKDEIVSELHSTIDYGEKLIQGELTELIETADVRGKRQRTVLLDRKLVEEADERWRMQLLDQIDRSVAGLIGFEVLSPDQGDAVRKELEQILLTKFEQDIASRVQNEIKLDDAAKTELKRLARQLSKPSPIQYYSDETEMLETEFQKWHNRQIKREDALKQVEDKIYRELTTVWENWLKRRDKIITNFTATLTVQLLTRGLELEQCDSIMQQHAKSRLELTEVIGASMLVQKAKFRARLNYLQERLFALTQQNKELFEMKSDVERKYLDKVKKVTESEESSILEEYLNDIKKLERSLSVEKLSIYISLKEKVSLRRRNKFVALHRHFIMKQEEEMSRKILEVLLERRKDVVFEIWTRSYEEERRRAEDEVMQEKGKMLNVSTDPTRSHTKAQTGVSNQLLSLSEPVEIQDETKMLLNSHQENLAKLSDKLKNQREKAKRDLELKMRQRRMQREKTLAQLMQPDWSQLQGSKFKQLVQKQMLTTRVEKIRKQHVESLTKALDDLQKEFEDKRQEAKEKLEKKLEAHLVKIGKASSEKLVEVFEEMHYSGPRRMSTLEPLGHLRRPSLQSAGDMERMRLTSPEGQIDPLLKNRPKQGELPPISTYLSRRGSL